jgi:hypothetical protein
MFAASKSGIRARPKNFYSDLKAVVSESHKINQDGIGYALEASWGAIFQPVGMIVNKKDEIRRKQLLKCWGSKRIRDFYMKAANLTRFQLQSEGQSDLGAICDVPLTQVCVDRKFAADVTSEVVSRDLISGAMLQKGTCTGITPDSED